MPWFKVDDKLHSHPKARRAGLEAMGLWSLAGSHCMDYLTDGVVEAWFVEAWPKGPKLAAQLVNVGLWDVHPDGWSFHGWEGFQPTREKVLAERERTKARVERFRNGDSNGVTNGVGTLSPSPVPSPSPDTTYVSQSSHVSSDPSPVDNSARGALTGMGINPERLMREIKSHTGRDTSPSVALRVAVEWLDRGVNVKKPLPYLLTCLRDNAVEVQQFIDGLIS